MKSGRFPNANENHSKWVLILSVFFYSLTLSNVFSQRIPCGNIGTTALAAQ